MTIEDDLKSIQNSIDELDISKIFNGISLFRKKYPQNNKINYLIEKNKKSFSKKVLISNKRILTILHSRNPQDALKELVSIYNKDLNNAFLSSIIGNLYGSFKKFDRAIFFQERSIYLNPFEETFYINLHETLTKNGYISKALGIILMAETLMPKRVEIELPIARSLFSNKYYDRSIIQYENLLKNTPKDEKLKIEFCQQLLKLKYTNKVKELANNIEDPKNIKQKNIILGLANFHEGNNELSKDFFEKAIDLDNGNSKYFTYIAKCYEQENEFTLAELTHSQALTNNEDNPLILKNFGTFYYKIGDFEKAEKFFLKAISYNTFDFDIRYNLSLVQLFQRKFKDGWLNYNYRWLSNNFDSTELKTKLPKFNKNKNFETIYIWAEQGIGDQILFARFLKNKIFLRKRIYCTVNSKLEKLFERSFPQVKFVQNIPHEYLASHMPIGDLGHICLETSKELKHNSESYLKSSNEKLDLINEEINLENLNLSNKKFCGISWLSKNNDFGKEKSINLNTLLPILELKDYIFINLQYGETFDERDEFFKRHDIKIVNIKLIDNYNDVDGLATLIDFCDIVLTVSNSTAHLAGALGKKTFLMKSKGKGSLWYWSSENRRSLWYKSIKIYEQLKVNDWKKVVEDIKVDIKKQRLSNK